MLVQSRLNFIPLPNEISPDGRVYVTPSGKFLSVTTRIHKYFGEKELNAWRKAVGEDRAAQISERARNRGEAVHKIFENYLDEKPIKAAAINLELFLKVKPFLEKSRITVFGVEIPLYSESLKTAGRADLVACWNEKFNCVVDFKTSIKPLRDGDNRWLKYKLQSTTYGMMVEEMFGIMMPYNMIIVLNSEGSPQIDINSSKPYRDQVRKIFT